MVIPAEERILVVDDERMITDTLVTIFSQARYVSRGAYSAEQALSTIEEWLPDVAIVDVMLPAMNGIDLAIRIKALHPKCHVSLFSGQTATADLLDSAARMGHSFEVFAKPIHPTAFLQIMRRHFAGRAASGLKEH